MHFLLNKKSWLKQPSFSEKIKEMCSITYEASHGQEKGSSPHKKCQKGLLSQRIVHVDSEGLQGAKKVTSKIEWIRFTTTN